MTESEISGSNAGAVTIQNISVRYAEQVVLLDTLDPDEVLAESNLRLIMSVSGAGGSKVLLEQRWRHHLGCYKTDTFDVGAVDGSVNGSRLGVDIKLHNGCNDISLKAVNPSGDVLAEKKFTLQYKGSFREWNETIFIAFFLAIIIRGLVVQAFWIPTGSMEPTLHGESKGFDGKIERQGDRILVNRFAYVFDFSLDGRIPFKKFGINPRFWVNMPKRGDIIVFKFPDPNPANTPKDYIKRVIGLPGDRVYISEEGIVHINGVPLYEPYVKCIPNPDGREWTVPQGKLFTMGDNRNSSADSRVWGFMPLENLKGQAVFNYLPIGRFAPIRSYSFEKQQKSDFADVVIER